MLFPPFGTSFQICAFQKCCLYKTAFLIPNWVYYPYIIIVPKNMEDFYYPFWPVKRVMPTGTRGHFYCSMYCFNSFLVSTFSFFMAPEIWRLTVFAEMCR